MEFEFYNKRSEKLCAVFLKTKKNFDKHLQAIKEQEYFYTTNRIPDNNYLSLLAFKTVELYSAFNKDDVRKNIYKFAKIAAKHNKQKLVKLKKEADKIIDKMIKNSYTRMWDAMPDYIFEIDDEVINHIKISLDVIGSGLYKITYNIYLQDKLYYQYWLLMVNNYPNLLQIMNIPIINRGKLLIHSGAELKIKHLAEYKNMITKRINKFIKKSAPGIFMKMYKAIPIVEIIEVDKVRYYYKIGDSLFHTKDMPLNEKTSFDLFLRNDTTDSGYDFYYNRNDHDTYIPSKVNNYLEPLMFSRHIRRRCQFTSTSLLFWLEIITQLYKIQINQVDNIQNNYIYKTIRNKLFGLSRARKKLYRTHALLLLLEDSYAIEKNDFEKPYNNNYVYYLNNSDELNIEYFSSSIHLIEKTKEKLKAVFPVISEIYDRKNQDNNNRSNVFFQIVAIVLTIFMLLQTLYQCSTQNNQDNHEKYENSKDRIEVDNIVGGGING